LQKASQPKISQNRRNGYFSAIEVSDLTALTQCFQPDIVIIDVNRKISGIEAIHAWAEKEVIGGHYE
jgi:hypothetical protein